MYKKGNRLNLVLTNEPIIFWIFSIFLFKNIFFVTTSGMFWEPSVKYTSSVLGIDKGLFAADYPYESSKRAVDFIDSMAIKDSDEVQICYLNAERLLEI